jgi:tetratricopeptide (TPR) repeat protein
VPRISHVNRPKPKQGRFRLSSSLVQWVVVAAVAAVMLFLLVRSLVNRPTDSPPIPLLAAAKTDLTTVTRMLGDIELDSAARALFPEELRGQLAEADTLSAQGRWTDAVSSLYRMVRRPHASEVAAARAYLGYCYYRAASPDHALLHLRMSLVLADTALPGLVPWLLFSIGYLFEAHGFHDSALVYSGRHAAQSHEVSQLSRIAVLNNMGVSREAEGDRAAAAVLYSRAAELLDSTADERPRRTVIDNLARVSPNP